MPVRDHGRGTLVIDRRFPAPIGRLKLASGTTHGPTFRAIDAMLTQFATEGRWDVLLALKERRVKPLYALSLVKGRKLVELAQAECLPPFLPLALDWAKGRESPSHQRDTAKVFHRLGDGSVGDLPDLLAGLRATWKASQWNHARNYVRGFLRDQVGVDHPLYQRVAALRPRKVAKRERGRPRSVDEVLAMCAGMGGLFGEMIWTLCATGMRPKEYWGEWRVEGDRVTIVVAKRGDKPKVRAVPAFTTYTRPVLGQRWLTRRMQRVDPDWQLYDTRRTFSRWCEEAQVIESNRKAYMGHGPKTVTDLYTMGEVPGQLAGDAARLAALLGPATRRVRLA